MQNVRRSVVNSTNRLHKQSVAVDRQMGLGVSTPSGSHSDKGVALSQSSGSSIDSDHSSRLEMRDNNECLTESDEDNSDDDDVDPHFLKDPNSNLPFDENLSTWQSDNGWSFSNIREATEFLRLYNVDSKELQDLSHFQAVDALLKLISNALKELENLPCDSPQSQSEKCKQIKTMIPLRNFLEQAAEAKDFKAIELVWKHLFDMRHESNENLLYAAAKRGCYFLCQCLIEMDINVNGRHLNNRTPIMGASSQGHLDIVQLLCSSRADVSLKTKDGDTALHLAAGSGHEAIVQVLIQQGANKDVTNKNGYTPLMEAASAGHLDAVKCLVEHGAKVGRHSESFRDTAFTLAAFRGHLDVVKYFIESGTIEGNPNELHYAFLQAAEGGHVDVGEFFLKFGVQVNKLPGSFDSPLTLACREGHVEFAEFLLKHGANIEECNGEDFTPLRASTCQSSVKMVEFLLSKGANVNAVMKNGEDAFMQACKLGHTKVAQLLLKAGAQHDRESESGHTALMFAAKCGHFGTVDFLVRKGSDVNKSSRHNEETVLSAACHNGNIKVVRLLLKHGADPHFTLKDGSTILIETVRGGHANVAKMLFNLPTDSPSYSSSQEENDDWSTGHPDDRDWQHDVMNQCPSVPQLNVSPTSSIASNDSPPPPVSVAAAIADGTSLPADGEESCSDESDLAEDDGACPNEVAAVKASISGNKKYRQLPPKWKFEQVQALPFKKQCLKQHGQSNNIRRCSSGSEPASANWKQYVTATQTQSLKIEKRLRSGAISTKSLLRDQKLHKGSSACEACGCCPATSIEELDKKSLQLLQKSLLKATGSDCPDLNAEVTVLDAMFDGQMKKFGCTSCFPSSYQGKLLKQAPCDELQAGLSCQALSTSSLQTLLEPQNFSQDLPHDFVSHSSITALYQTSAINVDAQTEGNQDTALTIACARGHYELVCLLHGKGANIEHKDKKGFNALLYAAHSGHETIVDYLLNNGAKIEAEADKTKDTALSLACANGHVKVIDLLLRKGANKEHRNVSDYSPLSQAASGGNTEAMEVLLHYGAEINSRTNSKLGISPLMLAAMNGHVKAVKLLLERGSDVNAVIETNRNSALTLAALQGHYEVVSLLLDHKASMEHRTKTGFTALMEAAQNGHVEVAKVLLNKGADVGISKETPLSIAAEKGHCKFIELLIRYNAPVDIKNKKGTTPLWMACNAGHLNVAKVLVTSGADPDSTDGRKVSCLVSALRKGHVEVVKYLVEHVNQLPPDPECQKFQNSFDESGESSDLIKNCRECLRVIKEAKEAQEMKAYKNAASLLDELQEEKKLEAKRRAAREKKREKKKQKKKDKVASGTATPKNIIESDRKSDDSNSQEMDLRGESSMPSDEESLPKYANISDEDVGEKENNPLKIVDQVNNKKKQPGHKDGQCNNPTDGLASNVKDLMRPKNATATTLTTGMPLQESKGQLNNKVHELVKDSLPLLKSKLSSISDLDDFGSLPPTNITVAPVLVSTPNSQKLKSDKIASKAANDGSLKDPSQQKIIGTAPGSRAVSSASSVTSLTKPVAAVASSQPATSTPYKPALVVNSAPSSTGLKGFGKKKPTATQPSSSTKKDDSQSFFNNSKDSLKKMKKIDVPARAVSRVIGRSGCNINAIREFSGAKIDLDKVKYSDDAVVTIRGVNDGVNKAAELIQALIRESDKDIDQLIAAFKQQQTSGGIVPSSSTTADVPVTTNAWKSGNASLALKTTLVIPTTYSNAAAKEVSLIPTSNVWESRKSALADQGKAPGNAWMKPQTPGKDASFSSRVSAASNSNVWDNSMADGVGKSSTNPSANDVADDKPEPITTFPIGAWKSVSKSSRERSPISAPPPPVEVEEIPLPVVQPAAPKEVTEWSQPATEVAAFNSSISSILSMATSTTVTSNAYLSFRDNGESLVTNSYSSGIGGSRSMTGEYSPFGASIFGSSFLANPAGISLPTNPISSSSDISADKSKAPGYRPLNIRPRSHTPPVSFPTQPSRPPTMVSEPQQVYNMNLNDHHFDAKFNSVVYDADPSSAHASLMMMFQAPKENSHAPDTSTINHEQANPSSQAYNMAPKLISTLNPNAPNFHSRPASMSPQNFYKPQSSSVHYMSNMGLPIGQPLDGSPASKLLQHTYLNNSIMDNNNLQGSSFGGDIGLGFPTHYSSVQQPPQFNEFAASRFSIGDDILGSNGLINTAPPCEGNSRESLPDPRKTGRLQPIGTERNNKKQQIMNSSGMTSSSTPPTSVFSLAPPSTGQISTSNQNIMINLQQGIANLPTWSFQNAPSHMFRSSSTNPIANPSQVMDNINSSFPTNRAPYSMDVGSSVGSGYRGPAMQQQMPAVYDQSPANMMPLGGFVLPNGSSTSSTNYPDRSSALHHFQQQQQPQSNPIAYHHHHSSSFPRLSQDMENWQLSSQQQQHQQTDLSEPQLWNMWPHPDRN